MSRAERKTIAEQRRKGWQLAWLEQLKLATESGMTWREACGHVSASAARLVEKEPQRKTEILNAWAEMFSELSKEARKGKAA